jgi:CheY-like chemotaxis protein
MGKILLVEDETLVQKSIARALKSYRVQVAGTVAEALTLLHSDQRWEALIADVGLPDGDGFTVVEAARTACPGVSMLVVTGDVCHHRVNRAFELGAWILAKPISACHLRRFIDPCPDNPVASLLVAIKRCPRRWDQATLTYAIAKLEGGEWWDIRPGEWPEVLDHLMVDLRNEIPSGIVRTRCCMTVH